MSLGIVMWINQKSAESLFEYLNTLPDTFVVFYNVSNGKQYLYDPSNPDKTGRWMGQEMEDSPPKQLLSDNLDEAVKGMVGDAL